MENCIQKDVSASDLFPLIREVIQHGHKARFTISGNSMCPWIKDQRDQVLLAGKADLKVGDIILYQNRQGSYILHRIMKMEAAGFRTMGDSCVTADEGLIAPSDVIGVVQKIYRNGKVINCDSLQWALVFLLWRILLPVRKELLRTYHMLVKMKYDTVRRKNSVGV